MPRYGTVATCRQCDGAMLPGEASVATTGAMAASVKDFTIIIIKFVSFTARQD